MQLTEYTSETKMLSSIFDSDDDLNTLTKRFIKKLNGCIKMNFRKIRTNNAKKSEDEKLHDKMRQLKGKNDSKSIQELEKIVINIAECAESKYKHVIKELNMMSPEEGRIDAQKFWKLKKRLFPRSVDPPSAMLDKQGNLITSKVDIENRAIEVYTERLGANQIKEHSESYEETANKLC